MSQVQIMLTKNFVGREEPVLCAP